ncbi:hypothetical protein M422DRAFT_260703 [Sphaerobolus stellatus SS14]|uniref:Myb-like domain-containing protein n=1 Tax=Sphaerobolus stellatus (strain SS14) TaxID=990650 RepID=A0A0C9U221_SPHS4|nr:hypothetical protein M422DRAFT_260703 [Sphaerobolus stellatus SS14]
MHRRFTKQTINLLANEKVTLMAQLEGFEELEKKYADVEGQLEKTRQMAKEVVARLKVAEEEREGTARRLEEVEKKEKAVSDKARDMELQRSSVGAGGAGWEAETEPDECDELTSSNERTIQEKTELQNELKELKSSHASLSTSHTDSEQACSSLESQFEALQAMVVSLQHQVSQLSSDLASHLNEVRTLEAEAKAQADDAEWVKNELQAENSELLAQLEEMRPKVVELSNKITEDEERMWNAEKRARGLGEEVERLERVLDERDAALQDAEGRVRELEDEMKKMEGKHASHVRLAHELVASKKTMEKLESKLEGLKTVVKERKREAKRLEEEVKNWEAEAELVRGALESSQVAEKEAVGMEGANVLQESPRNGQVNLSDELLSNLRQQHTLDMLTAHSRIRELETKVFDAQVETHVFQRRIKQLEDELLQLRASKSALATPSSERQSFNSMRPHTKVLAPRPVYEDNLLAETRREHPYIPVTSGGCSPGPEAGSQDISQSPAGNREARNAKKTHWQPWQDRFLTKVVLTYRPFLVDHCEVAAAWDGLAQRLLEDSRSQGPRSVIDRTGGACRARFKRLIRTQKINETMSLQKTGTDEEECDEDSPRMSKMPQIAPLHRRRTLKASRRIIDSPLTTKVSRKWHVTHCII